MHFMIRMEIFQTKEYENDASFNWLMLIINLVSLSSKLIDLFLSNSQKTLDKFQQTNWYNKKTNQFFDLGLFNDAV